MVSNAALNRRTLLVGLALVAAMGAAAAARAETHEIRFAKQFSMGYVQFDVIENRKLIEKQAAALGLANVKVTWAVFNGPAGVNDALLSNSVDIAAGGVPALVTLWAKTKGTALQIKGISALSSQPFLLNTRDPRIRGVEDFTAADRIAVPTVKVSVQAVTLQMAAAKTFGFAKYDTLDALTISLAPPDATIGLIAGNAGFTSAFSVPPFQQQQLDHPDIHTVLDSFQVMDGPHTFTVAWTTSRFREQNPILYRALMRALDEATEIINADKRAAAALWIADTKPTLALDFVDKVLAGPDVRWTLVPENTMKYAAFMHRVGSIKEVPASWKDLFFPEIHDRPGS